MRLRIKNDRAQIQMAVHKTKRFVDNKYGRQSNRQDSLDGLKMVSVLKLTQDKVQFDNNFPVGGFLQVPRTREETVLGTTALLRKMFLDDTPEAEVEKTKGPHLIRTR